MNNNPSLLKITSNADPPDQIDGINVLNAQETVNCQLQNQSKENTLSFRRRKDPY